MRANLRMSLVLFSLLLGSCSQAPKKAETSPVREHDESSVEINFTRGHNDHRLLVSLKGGSALAQSFLDRQVLAESAVDRTRYLSFLQRASDFLKASHGAAPERFPCRTPFTITVRIGAETRAASGCANADEGALSHLVRDGEFLLHQGSGMRVK